MTITLRIVLIAVCGLTCWYTLRKIRKSQMRIEDSLFFILLSFGLAGISIFPQVAEFFSELLGIFSPANFVFLAVIFLLMMKVFTLTLRYSQLEEKLKRFVQRFAIEEEKWRDGEEMQKYSKKNGEERNKKASTKESDRGGGGTALNIGYVTSSCTSLNLG